jgi:hypothetical protein
VSDSTRNSRPVCNVPRRIGLHSARHSLHAHILSSFHVQLLRHVCYSGLHWVYSFYLLAAVFLSLPSQCGTPSVDKRKYIQNCIVLRHTTAIAHALHLHSQMPGDLSHLYHARVSLCIKMTHSGQGCNRRG